MALHAIRVFGKDVKMKPWKKTCLIISIIFFSSFFSFSEHKLLEWGLMSSDLEPLLNYPFKAVSSKPDPQDICACTSMYYQVKDIH